MLFLQYKATVAMLGDSAKRYQEAREIVAQTQKEITGLSFEQERLIAAIQAAVAEEVGGAVVVGVVPERAGERVSEAVVAVHEEAVDLR